MLENLQRLDLSNSNFNDARLLAPLEHLVQLTLKNTDVAYFSQLGELPRLQELHLAGAVVKGPELESLKSANPSLRIIQ
ncbi:MAG: hypothetical protein CMJ78_12930 [Planctomycetaceae bacterium]|nr:hypothetical protein [Planctomycetaceae bacterium]